MNKFISTALVLLFGIYGITTTAQISIGKAIRPKFSDEGTPKVDKEVLEYLKQSVTILFLRPRDEEWIPMLEERLSTVWTLTPLEIHSIANAESALEKHKGNPISTFLFQSKVKQFPSSEKPDGCFLEANFSLLIEGPWGNDGTMESRRLATIELSLDEQSIEAVQTIKNLDEKIIPYLYEEANILNFTPDLIIQYLKFINDRLLVNDPVSFYTTYVYNREEFGQLENTTLYIIDNLTQTYIHGKKIEKAPNSKKLLSKYPYKYSLISTGDIANILLQEGKPINIMLFTMTGDGRKFINIFNTEKGLIYSRYAPPCCGFQFKEEDMEILTKLIKKAQR